MKPGDVVRHKREGWTGRLDRLEAVVWRETDLYETIEDREMNFAEITRGPLDDFEVVEANNEGSERCAN